MTVARTIIAGLAGVMLASCASPHPRRVQPSIGAAVWTSTDGKTMPWRSTLPPRGAKVRAVVITIHGLSGAASDFWLLHERLPPRGYAVYGYELRGQGNDPEVKSRGDICSTTDWLRDLAAFDQLVRQRHPGLPVFWYGESLGSLIALHTAAVDDPDGLLLASPVAGLRVNVPPVERCLLKTGAAIAPRIRVTLGGLAGVREDKIRVTSTSTHGGQMAKTPHHVASFSLRLLRGVGRMIDANAVAAARLRQPVVFLASPNDVMSAPDQVQALFRQIASSDKSLHWYTRSYHLLLHDVQHEDVVAGILKWLDQHTGAKGNARKS